MVQSGRFVQGVGLVCHGSPTVTFSQHPLQVNSDTSYCVVHMTRCQFWAHAFARSTVVASSNVYGPPRGYRGGRTLSGLLCCHISLTASRQYNTTSLSLCAETERSPDPVYSLATAGVSTHFQSRAAGQRVQWFSDTNDNGTFCFLFACLYS